MPAQLAGLPRSVATIGDLELDVVIADTPQARRAGLMHVTDFGTIEGMAFVFDAPTETGFFMRDVPAPLDIAFVDAEGTVLDVLTMAVCTSDPCPTYHAPGPFLWALETPEGALARIEAGDRFELRPYAAATTSGGASSAARAPAAAPRVSQGGG